MSATGCAVVVSSGDVVAPVVLGFSPVCVFPVDVGLSVVELSVDVGASVVLPTPVAPCVDVPVSAVVVELSPGFGSSFGFAVQADPTMSALANPIHVRIDIVSHDTPRTSRSHLSLAPII